MGIGDWGLVKFKTNIQGNTEREAALKKKGKW